MGILSTVETAVEGAIGDVNVPALIAAGQSLVAAWPAISSTIAAEETELPPLVAAIEKALTGQTPTDADWTNVDAQLDAADSEIAADGAAAQAELDKRAAGTP